jgi:D-inositol-3-phosphate glycosyltransferase
MPDELQHVRFRFSRGLTLLAGSDFDGPSVFGYETDNLRRAAFISVHTSPLASLGGKDAGGMNVYVRELSCNVANLGLPVDVFTRRTSVDAPEVTEICKGVILVNITAGPHEPVDKNSLYRLLPEFAEQMVLYGLRAGARYDVAHAHYWLSGWTAHLLKRYWELPFTVMFHTTAHMKNRVSPVAEHETRLRAHKERRLVTLADSIIAANPDERADLIWRQRAPSERICTIPPGVDVELFRPLDRSDARTTLGFDNDGQIVLFVGRIDPIKGIDTLLGSFARVVQEHPGALLAIVGGDLDEHQRPIGPLDSVQRGASRIGIADRIRFFGSQPQNRLPLFYSAADVVCVPSRYESFGLVAVEAMACGAPVVASRAGGLIFTIEDGVTGFLAPIDDPEGHARAVSTILSEPALGARMGLNGHLTAQKFSWHAVASSVIHVYQRLAEGHRKNLCCDEEIYA